MIGDVCCLFFIIVVLAVGRWGQESVIEKEFFLIRKMTVIDGNLCENI